MARGEAERAIRLWKELREWVSVDPQVKIDCMLSEEAAVDAIVNTAAEQHCDLIVIGTHGRRETGPAIIVVRTAARVATKACCIRHRRVKRI